MTVSLCSSESSFIVWGAMGKPGVRTEKFKGPLTGLAKALANKQCTRELLLETKRLVVWPAPEKTGIINATSLRMNVDLMIAVGSIICEKSETPAGLYVGPIKDEAWGVKDSLTFAINLCQYKRKQNLY